MKRIQTECRIFVDTAIGNEQFFKNEREGIQVQVHKSGILTLYDRFYLVEGDLPMIAPQCILA